MDEQKKQQLIQAAKQAGWSPDEIARGLYEINAGNLLAAKQTETKPAQAQPKKEKGFSATDLIPLAGGVVGAVGGSFIAPGAGTVAGGAIGAGLGETFRQKLTKEKTDVGRIGTEAALSALPVGKVFGAGGKILSKVVGKTAGGAAENLALRVLKPSKTQMTKFARKTGEKLEDFIVRNKLFEKGTQQVDDILTPLQQQYDDLALSTATRVKPTLIYAGFAAKIKELKAIPNTQAKALAGQLSSELKLVKKAFKKKPDIGMDELTNLRRQVDQLIPESKFSADPLMQGKNRYVRNIYKEIIDSATAGKTAPVGKELSKLYAFRELADLQSQLGRGNLPIGMTALIGTVTGGVIGGGGTLATGGSSGDAIRNALLGMGFVHLANNPKVLSLAVKALNKISKIGVPGLTPQTTSLPGRILGEAIDQGATRVLAAPFRGGDQNAGELPAELSAVTFPGQAEAAVPTPPADTTQQISGGYTKEQLINAADWDLKNNQGKGIGEIKQLYDLHFGASKPKSATIKNMENLANAGLKGLVDAKAMYEKDPNIVIKGAATAGLASRKFEAAMNRAIEGILRARSGAAVPETEVRKYRLIYGPKLGDSTDVGLYKLEALRQDLEGIRSGNENVVLDQLPASPTQVTFP